MLCLFVYKNSYVATLFSTAFTTTFFGLIWLGQNSSLMDGRPGVKVSDVKVPVDKLQITFSVSKTDQSMVGVVIILDRVVSSPKCGQCQLYICQLLNKQLCVLGELLPILIIYYLQDTNFKLYGKKQQIFLLRIPKDSHHTHSKKMLQPWLQSIVCLQKW